MSADQLVHMMRQAVSQPEATPFRYGHIASYDPATHRVRCIIPSLTDEDGVPTLSPWMPMGTLSAGNGYGVQVIYQGGATVDNPTAGEQVLIATFDRQRGVSAVPCMFFGGGISPPNVDLPQQSDGFASTAAAGAPGDVLISAPPATAGGANSLIRLRQNGDIEIWSAGKLTANVVGDANVTVGGNSTQTVTGNATVTAQGNATVTAQGVIDLNAPTVNCSGTVNASGDVVASGISLITHAHSE
jgi:hypothetical protein